MSYKEVVKMEKKLYRIFWLLWVAAGVSLLIGSLMNEEWLYAIIFGIAVFFTWFLIKGYGDKHVEKDDDDDDDEASRTTLVLRKIWANRSVIYIVMFAIMPMLLPGKTVLRLCLCFALMAATEIIGVWRSKDDEAPKPKKRQTGPRKPVDR